MMLHARPKPLRFHSSPENKHGGERCSRRHFLCHECQGSPSLFEVCRGPHQGQILQYYSQMSVVSEWVIPSGVMKCARVPFPCWRLTVSATSQSSYPHLEYIQSTSDGKTCCRRGRKNKRGQQQKHSSVSSTHMFRRVCVRSGRQISRLTVISHQISSSEPSW